MKTRKFWTLLVVLAFVVVSFGSTVAFAQEDTEMALFFTPPGKGDLGWNYMAWLGAKKAKEEGYISDFSDVITTEADALGDTNMLARTGQFDILVSSGWELMSAFKSTANSFPDLNYMTLDTRPAFEEGDPGDKATLGTSFRQEQGSALAGALAALVAAYHDDKHVGIVLGKEGQVLYEFEMGYKWGVNWGVNWIKENKPSLVSEDNITGVKKKDRVLWTYVGSWSDTAGGRQAAEAQIAQGASVIFTAAGGTGIGALQFVADYHNSNDIPVTKPPYAIGVDSNQDWINPYIIASALKRVDTAVVKTARAVANGNFRDMVKDKKTLWLGLDDNGVGLSDEEKLKSWIDQAQEAGIFGDKDKGKILENYRELRNAQPDWVWGALDDLRQQIIEGEVEIPRPFGNPEKWNIDDLRKEYG